MTAAQLIHEIDCLPPAELAKVVHHTKKLAEVRQLSPDELGVLIDQFVEATNPQQVERLRENITQGFYGRQLRCREVDVPACPRPCFSIC